MRLWPAITCLSLLTGPALANEKPQIVTIQVVDGGGTPIRTAWVRVPGIQDHRDVDSNGLWEASTLPKYDGSLMSLTKGSMLELTIAAPGFYAQSLRYEIRPRRNEITVSLQAMPTPTLVENVDEDDDMMNAWLRKGLPSDEG